MQESLPPNAFVVKLNYAFFHNLPSGGALRALYEKIKQLEARGHCVSLYTLEGSEADFLPAPAISGSVFKWPLDFTGPFRCGRYLRISKKAAQAIDRSNADIVFVDKCRYFGAPPLLQFLKKPALFYAHEPLGLKEYSLQAVPAAGAPQNFASYLAGLTLTEKFRKALRWPERNFIKREDRKSIRRATSVLTSSRFAAQWIQRVYDLNASVCYQGVDVNFFKPAPNFHKSGQLLSVGRIEPRKGHLFLLRTISKIPKDQRPPLIIVCDAVDQKLRVILESESKALAVDLKIIHRPPQEELRDLYRSSSLVLCASIYEPFGLVPIEAMACGAPVLAVKEGGFVETVLDGQTGFLLDRDERSWAQKIKECLTDPPRMERMGQEGRKSVLTRWTWDLFADRLEKITEEVLCRKSH